MLVLIIYYNIKIMILMTNMTTISIKRETRDQIASLAHKDESFEMVIRKLLEKYGEGK